MPKFDMKNAGGGNAAPNELRWVYISDIVPNERNEIYSTEGIESLADDILVHGLLQPPLVHPVEDGKYKIISGHRRILALKKLADSGNAEFNKIQVVIDNDNDETSLGLKLISANAENRILSNMELLAQTQEYMALLSEYKKKENLPGKVRDMVAKKLNVSTGTVSELLAIGKNLKEPLLMHFKDGWINKTVAVEMSKLSQEQQMWVADEIWNCHRQFTVKEIKEMRVQAAADTSSSATPKEDANEGVSEDVSGNEEVIEEVKKAEEKEKAHFKNYELEIAQRKIMKSVSGVISACEEIKKHGSCEGCPLYKHQKCLLDERPMKEWLNNIHA